MNDKAAILIGILVLVLGILVFLTPVEFKVRLEFLPLSLGGIMVLALGTFLLIVGLVSFFVERME